MQQYDVYNTNAKQIKAIKEVIRQASCKALTAPSILASCKALTGLIRPPQAPKNP